MAAKAKAGAVAVPSTLYLARMKEYVTKHYSVNEISADSDLESTVKNVMKSTGETQMSHNLRTAAEDALFSIVTFRLNISFQLHSNGSATAEIPEADSSTARRIRHLELYFGTGIGSIQIAHGPSFSRVSAGMQSLKDQFPQLDTLYVHLCINVLSPSVAEAISGTWMKDARDIAMTSTFGVALNYMLERAKAHGPGEKKIFKLTIEPRVDDRDGRQIKNKQPWTCGSPEIEFGTGGSNNILLAALEGCEKAAQQNK